MSRQRRLLRNVVLSAAQVVIVGGTFFVLYRFLLDAIGEEDFGVWAVVLATTSASGIANLGLAVSTVKFVSQYLARGEEARVAAIIQTAALSVGAFLAVVLLAAYPLLDALLAVIIEPASKLPAARAVLPYALTSFWLTSLALVFQSGLDGYQRIDLRSLLIMGASLAYLGLAFALVPRQGLLGLARAQVAQAGLMLVASWIVLKGLVPALPLLPYRWRRDAFTEMLGYSLNFQVISVTQMLFEPTTKALVSRFGGVGVVAYFEMAYRMVFQLRALIATAHQAIVPTIADLQETNPARLQDVYKQSYRLLTYLILASLPLLLAVTPLISRLWIGAYEPAFVVFAALLLVGWFLNLLANPAYYANMGTGRLRWNVIGHLVIGMLNAGLGLLLGWRYGGVGVVIGFVIALLTGSFVIARAYHREQHIRLSDVLQRQSLLLGLAGGAGLALALFLYYRFAHAWDRAPLALLMLATYLAVIAVPLWRHPAREQLQAWLEKTLRRRNETPSTES